MKLLKKYFPLLLILSVSVFYFFTRLGRDFLNDWDECIYAAYTHSMKIGGDILVNHFNGYRVFDKPPLYMWMQSVATFFGESEYSFRVLSALASLALLTAVYLFSQKYFSRKVALLACLLLLSSESIVSRSIIVNTDIFFTLFVFLAVWLWIESDKKGWLSTTAGAFLGLGVMVKGLGSLQFLAVFLLCAILEQRRDAVHRFLKLFGGFLVVVAPWHITAFALYPKEFIDVYLYDNLVKRSIYAIENHHERWFFYFKLLISEFFPWIVFLALAPASLYRRLKSTKSFKDFKLAWERNRVLFTLLLMILLPLLSMSRVMTKLSWYVMPILPFLAILLGYYITVFIRRFTATVMQGTLGTMLITFIYGIAVLLISIDAFTALSRNVRITHDQRTVSPRNEAIFKTQTYPEKTLEYLVPFGERQGRSALPPTEQIAQTWLYGGNACAVYYSRKTVNYHYYPEEFVRKMNNEKGIYFVENGDLHFLDEVKNKKKVFENIEYTIFSQ